MHVSPLAPAGIPPSLYGAEKMISGEGKEMTTGGWVINKDLPAISRRRSFSFLFVHFSELVINASRT
jgi:hypothetical protein